MLIADDTNVWVNNTTEKTQRDEATRGTKQVKQKGMKKSAPLLGMLQSVTLKRVGSNELDCVALHCPSQILPKQNAGTILSRIRRWCVYSSEGSSMLGGEELRKEFEKIPLKMFIWCAGLSGFSSMAH